MDLNNTMLSVGEFRNSLLKRCLYDINTCCTVSTRDLYRANWSIKKFMFEFELYLGKRIKCYYVYQLDYWVVRVQ